MEGGYYISLNGQAVTDKFENPEEAWEAAADLTANYSEVLETGEYAADEQNLFELALAPKDMPSAHNYPPSLGGDPLPDEGSYWVHDFELTRVQPRYGGSNKKLFG
jgi:hypothetical protein